MFGGMDFDFGSTFKNKNKHYHKDNRYSKNTILNNKTSNTNKPPVIKVDTKPRSVVVPKPRPTPKPEPEAQPVREEPKPQPVEPKVDPQPPTP